ncbi:potassium transporter Kup [Phycicoccus duodecadis]|uniref:Probable potassium transport system protein Kup n=1 Tax=Phycicoccus duodecadis TaxID=173053 RepID=A0A2N3YID2_9MICO|nr:potassium transporter Kup [Phycicoccus duodecadis]PKW26617.1 KUP system potassium uptake protein [Phycicoccus duodecadis]
MHAEPPAETDADAATPPAPDAATPPVPGTPVHRAGLPTLVLGAIGVVFGDIGTSPLYAMKTVFAIDDGVVRPTADDVYGVISLIVWSLTLVVSVKYVLFILRADNDGEGGVLALAHLARQGLRPGGRRWRLAMLLGVLGASLFYGDSLITPAISVLSAIEGLEVSTPAVAHLVVPVGAAVITALFVVQRFGTEVVGRAFGPVMVLWFAVLAALGIGPVLRDPAVLLGLSPHYAVLFVLRHPLVAFVAMGAVVLVITGAEALYADMGHFGTRAIRVAWFALAFPALTLNYLGQAAEILRDPGTSASPFFLLAPGWAQVPLVVLATLATVIASQAVISGAFSMSRQGERLGFIPRLTIRQTSQSEGGQIYAPAVNWLLFAGVIVLLVAFRSSERLATAYGLAVTGTFLITTTLFLFLARTRWAWSTRRMVAFAVPIYLLEAVFFAANLTKVATGGWLPLLVAGTVCTLMLTWSTGRDLVTERRRKLEGPIGPFIDWLHTDPVSRVEGTAVFLHPDNRTTPLAFRENARFNHVIHENVWIVSTTSENHPHVPDEERVVVDHLGDPYDAIAHLTLRFGFQDDVDVPAGLRLAAAQGHDIDVDGATYFVSRITLHSSDRPGMSRWRKRVFLGLARNAASPVEYFRLPIDRVVVMGAQVRF